MNQTIWVDRARTIGYFILFEKKLQFSILHESNWNVITALEGSDKPNIWKQLLSAKKISNPSKLKNSYQNGCLKWYD